MICYGFCLLVSQFVCVFLSFFGVIFLLDFFCFFFCALVYFCLSIFVGILLVFVALLTSHPVCRRAVLSTFGSGIIFRLSVIVVILFCVWPLPLSCMLELHCRYYGNSLRAS